VIVKNGALSPLIILRESLFAIISVHAGGFRKQIRNLLHIIFIHSYESCPAIFTGSVGGRNEIIARNVQVRHSSWMAGMRNYLGARFMDKRSEFLQSL
jgi:hypothetical protein